MHGIDLFHDGVLLQCAVECYMGSAFLIVEDLDLIEPGGLRVSPKGIHGEILLHEVTGFGKSNL